MQYNPPIIQPGLVQKRASRLIQTLNVSLHTVSELAQHQA